MSDKPQNVPNPHFLHIIFTYLFLLGISTFSLAQKPIDQQIDELQTQLGDKLTMVADGLELYNLAKDGNLNQAALYFQKKTGIHIYPAFLFRTKIPQLNTFFDDYNQARFKQLPEPYIIILYTITDTTAAFQYELSPTLIEKKAKLDVLLQSKAGGFALGGNKKKFLSGMPTLAFNLKELADQMSLDGLVDKLGILAGDLKEAFLKAIKAKRDTLQKQHKMTDSTYKIKHEEAISAINEFNDNNILSQTEETEEETSEASDNQTDEFEADIEPADKDNLPENVKETAKKASDSYLLRGQRDKLLVWATYLANTIKDPQQLDSLVNELLGTKKEEFFQLALQMAQNQNKIEAIVKEFIEKKLNQLPATK